MSMNKVVDEERISNEVDIIVSDQHLVGINIQPDRNDIHHLTATISGPVSTPYEGGIFHIDINLPDKYPFVPPHLRFVTKIWHPNIGSESGVVNLSILKEDWSPALNLKLILISLQAILSDPQLSYRQDAAVAIQYVEDNSRFIRKARCWTQTHAANPAPPPQMSIRASGKRFTKLPKHLNDFLL